jgi:hypothetical protein
VLTLAYPMTVLVAALLSRLVLDGPFMPSWNKKVNPIETQKVSHWADSLGFTHLRQRVLCAIDVAAPTGFMREARARSARPRRRRLA